MSSGAKSLLITLTIPLLAAIGHDVYLNYFSDDEKIRQAKNLQIDPTDFLASDLGWVWQTYSASTMDYARQMVTPETWTDKIDPILQMNTMLASATPLAIGATYLLIAFMLGIWPFSRFGRLRRQKEDDFVVYKHAKEKDVKFTRK